MMINWSIRSAPRAAWFLFKLNVQFLLERRFNRTGRHDQVLAYVREHADSNNPAAVLAAMDDFARRYRWLMNIGPAKGQILIEALREADVRNVLEIGAFCGYSATLIGQYLMKKGGRLTSIEKSGRLAHVAQEIVAHAGLSDIVEVRKGTLSTELASLPGPFDGVLLDHWKDEYLPDLKRLEQNGMLHSGTVVVADNVGFFAVPDYLEYVRECGRYKTRFVESTVEYNEKLKDGVEVSVFIE